MKNYSIFEQLKQGAITCADVMFINNISIFLILEKKRHSLILQKSLQKSFNASGRGGMSWTLVRAIKSSFIKEQDKAP